MAEHDEQCLLFQILDFNKHRDPRLKYIFAIPNGGHRFKGTAARLKREGVRRGVPDIFCPVASDGWMGLFIEMKYGANTLTEEQKDYRRFLTSQGYRFEVCRSAAAALKVIENYFRINLNSKIF